MQCAHARAVVSGRGSTFWRCGLSTVDARFPKYPPLPVLRCDGFAPAAADAGSGPPSPDPAGTR